jgi:L-iditol 2-dehydrogenase
MKAVALTSLRRLELRDLPAPAIRTDHEVLLQVRRVGVCGSDLHYFQQGRIGNRVVEFPFLIGHECSGTVLEAGAGVTRVKPGDEVAVDPAMSCHACDQCLAGREHTCRQLRFLGCPGEAEGCLSELLVLPEACLYPTRGQLTLDQAVLCEPFSIGLYATRLAGIAPAGEAGRSGSSRSEGAGPGAAIGILGAGPIGLCVLLAARAVGAGPVFMTDRIAERVEFARRLGASWVGNPDDQPVVAAIQQLHPAGLDAVFECAGQPDTLDQAVALLRPGGTLAIVGIPQADRVSFPIDHLRRKEITIVNVRRQNQCVEPAMRLVAGGHARVDALLTHRFRPERAQEAFELVESYRSGVIKAVIEF